MIKAPNTIYLYKSIQESWKNATWAEDRVHQELEIVKYIKVKPKNTVDKLIIPGLILLNFILLTVMLLP